MDKKNFTIKQQNQILEKFSNFNKYINKLLELSPNYFKDFINNFDNNFNMSILNNNYVNKMNESFLINIKELKELSKEISITLRNGHDLIENNISQFDKETQFLNSDIKNMYDNLSKLNKIFSTKLVHALQDIKNENNLNKDKTEKIISFEHFTKFNDSKICENNKYIENIKTNLKTKKYKKNYFYIIIFSLSIISFLIFLILLLK